MRASRTVPLCFVDRLFAQLQCACPVNIPNLIGCTTSHFVLRVKVYILFCGTSFYTKIHPFSHVSTFARAHTHIHSFPAAVCPREMAGRTQSNQLLLNINPIALVVLREEDKSIPREEYANNARITSNPQILLNFKTRVVNTKQYVLGAWNFFYF